jgi:hypothetical protein
MLRPITVSLSIGAMIIILLGSVNAVGQSEPVGQSAEAKRDKTLNQLLVEVRELRLALERTTSISTRFHMLIERWKVEQADADLLDKNLETVRSQLNKLAGAKVEASDQLKDLEKRITESSNDERQAIEIALKEIRRNLELRTAEETRQLQVEADLVMRRRMKDSKLTELNGELDQLLNELKSP